jgi:transcriptional regulator with XRE-family HTH domain
MSEAEQQRDRVMREQIRAARALLGWDQARLAEAAGVSLITVKRFEAADAAVSADTLGKIRRAVEGAGVEFVTGEGHIGVIRLTKPRRGKS